MEPFFQSDPRAEFRRLYFTCVDAAALQTRLQSSDMSTFVAKVQKNGTGSVASSSNSPVQCNSTDLKGQFYLELTTTELNTPGIVNITITNTGGTKTMEPREFAIRVEPAVFGTAITGTLTATAFTTSLTSTVTNKHMDLLCWFLTGNCADETKKIGAYNGTSKTITLVTGLTYSAAPANGDIFRLVNR